VKRVFDEVKDLNQPKFKLEIGPQLSVWNSGRGVALTEQHLQHSIECMSTFIPMGEEAAEPIFWPYFQGLALIAKSDIHLSGEESARAAFITGLRARYYTMAPGMAKKPHSAMRSIAPSSRSSRRPSIGRSCSPRLIPYQAAHGPSSKCGHGEAASRPLSDQDRSRPLAAESFRLADPNIPNESGGRRRRDLSRPVADRLVQVLLALGCFVEKTGDDAET